MQVPTNKNEKSEVVKDTPTTDASIEKPFIGVETNPSNWEINPDGEEIEARNVVSARVFRGSTKEFSALL